MTTKKKPHVVNNSTNNEWYTPLHVLSIVRQILGTIELDPASSKEANINVQAKQYYTKETNGLERDWHGKVFLNPPYSRDLLEPFIDKLLEELNKKNTTEAVLLINNATETKWCQKALKNAQSVCCIEKRLKFLTPKATEMGSPLQGQLLLYYGNNIKTFKEHTSKLGIVLNPTNKLEIAKALVSK